MSFYLIINLVTWAAVTICVESTIDAAQKCFQTSVSSLNLCIDTICGNSPSVASCAPIKRVFLLANPSAKTKE
jgi:hypothetical protein